MSVVPLSVGTMGPSSLQVPLQFHKKLPALPENLELRCAGQHPTDIEKLKPSEAPSDLGPLDRPGFQTPAPLSILPQEKENLVKKDVKRKKLEELVRARVPQDQPQVLLKPVKRKSKLIDYRPYENKSKVPGLFPGSQLSSEEEEVSPGIKLYLHPSLERSFTARPRTVTHEDPGPKTFPKAAESRSMLELRRLEKELSGCIQKIEGVATIDRMEEDLNQVEAEESCITRKEQAARTTLVLYALLEQVKEIQEDLDKLNPFKIKNTTDELDLLLERTQSLRNKKKDFPKIQSQLPLNFPGGLESTSLISLGKEKKSYVIKEKLPQEGRRPVVRKFPEEKQRCSSMFPLLQMLNDGLGDQYENNSSSIVKVKPTSAKAKTTKNQLLTPNGILPRRSIRNYMKSQQI